MSIAKLRDLIRGQKVFAIVGTGISLSACGDPLASWEGMILDGIQRCEAIRNVPVGWGDRRRGDVASGDLDELLGAAEQVARKLGAPRGGEFRRFLRETAGALRIRMRETIQALCDLNVPIATTNYDGLLEDASGLEPVTWRDLSRVQRLLAGEDAGILHLHGYWREPDSVVFGIRSYEDVLRDAGAQQVLRSLPLHHSLLFVGCGDGLQDPNFGTLLGWMRTVLPETERRHYRLAREREMTALRSLHPIEGRVIPISYGADYAALAPVLRSLV